MNQNYILLNGKPFKFANREHKETDVGGDWKILLNGNVTRDYSATINEWTFQIRKIDRKALSRLKTIYDLKNSFNFTDYDGEIYTVLWFATQFNYNEIYPGIFNIEIPLREVVG